MDFKRVTIMLEKNINYYASCASRNSGIEYDDARQEILLRMFKASKKYDETKSRENTFFITVIKRESQRLIKLNLEKKRKEEKLFVDDESRCTIFTVINNGHSQSNMLIDKTVNLKVFFEEKVMNGCILDEVEKQLNAPYDHIFQLFRKGYDLKSISEELNWSKQRICNGFREKIKPKIIKNLG